MVSIAISRLLHWHISHLITHLDKRKHIVAHIIRDLIIAVAVVLFFFFFISLKRALLRLVLAVVVSVWCARWLLAAGC